MSLTMTQWDALDEYDRAWAFGLDILDAEEKVGRCAACGGPADVCQDTDNQHAYVVSVRRCFRTRALQEEQRKPRWHYNELSRLAPLLQRSIRRSRCLQDLAYLARFKRPNSPSISHDFRPRPPR